MCETHAVHWPGQHHSSRAVPRGSLVHFAWFAAPLDNDLSIVSKSLAHEAFHSAVNFGMTLFAFVILTRGSVGPAFASQRVRASQFHFHHQPRGCPRCGTRLPYAIEASSRHSCAGSPRRPVRFSG